LLECRATYRLNGGDMGHRVGPPANTLSAELAGQAAIRASFEACITFRDPMNTQGNMVALVAGQASGDPDTQPYVRHYIHRLECLAEELAKHGLVTRLLTPTGRVPSLHVVNPAVSRLAEDVYAGRSQDGLWWFWWPWAERIAPGDQLATAAAQIARVLSSQQ
jgi:hypothetical protein